MTGGRGSWSAVVTAFNSAETLGMTLDSLLSLPDGEKPLDITVVDNLSSDNSRETALSRPGVRLIANRRNTGLARANNLGADHSRGESLFFLNPDATVTPGCIDTLTAFAGEHPDAALLGPGTVGADGTHRSTARTWPSLSSVAARRTPFGVTGLGRSVADRHLHSFPPTAPAKVPWLVGAALWLTPRGRSTVGLMNPAYFLYFEDVEWCWRAWTKRMEVWYVPEARVIHECRRQSAGFPGRAAVHHFVSMLRFFLHHPSALLGKGPGPR